MAVAYVGSDPPGSVHHSPGRHSTGPARLHRTDEVVVGASSRLHNDSRACEVRDPTRLLRLHRQCMSDRRPGHRSRSGTTEPDRAPGRPQLPMSGRCLSLGSAAALCRTSTRPRRLRRRRSRPNRYCSGQFSSSDGVQVAQREHDEVGHLPDCERGVIDIAHRREATLTVVSEQRTRGADLRVCGNCPTPVRSSG